MKSNKQKETQNSKSYKFLIIVLSILVPVLFYYLFVYTSDKTEKKSKKVVENNSLFKFKKEGELTFNSKNGEYISSIEIEFANDDNERATGLMFRTEMAENNGMLFLFPYERMQSFYMRNTFISLDIIYVNSKFEIVTILKNTEPFSETSLVSTKPAQYVVEVIAGYTDKYGISLGDKISWRTL